MLSKIDKSSGLFVAAAVVFFWIGGALTTFAEFPSGLAMLAAALQVFVPVSVN